MVARKDGLVAAAMGALALAGCDPLPRPDYVDVTPPASYQTEDGVRIDNAGYKLDSQGYRLDTDGERLGLIEVLNEDDQSNAVAGYYISSTGQIGPGRVASTNDIVAPPQSEPMQQQTPITTGPAHVLPPPGYK